LRVRDFEVLRLRDGDAVLRVRDFEAVLAREAGLRLAWAGLAGVAAFGASAGVVSVCFWVVSVAMFGSSVSGAWICR
jgi:hypothetical protein